MFGAVSRLCSLALDGAVVSVDVPLVETVWVTAFAFAATLDCDPGSGVVVPDGDPTTPFASTLARRDDAVHTRCRSAPLFTFVVAVGAVRGPNCLVAPGPTDCMSETNVLGGELEPCSEDPMTGYNRDGCCRHVPADRGRHEVCAVVTEAFLEFSRERGNDLVTPRPEFDFPGLEPGDRWCLCLGRWVEALEADCAPPVVLEATNEAVLDDVPFSTFNEHEYVALEHEFD